MTRRTLLISLGLLVVGVLLGALLVTLLRPSPGPAAGEAVGVGGGVAAPPAGEPVRIGDPDPPAPAAVPELMSLNRLFRSVAARVTPTVVFIEVETRADGRGREFEEWHPFVQPRRFRRSAGSGVIVSGDGYVVTNAHVIAGAERIRVLLNDKREFDAETVGMDPTTDLAVIRLLGVGGGAEAEGAPLPVVALAEPDALEVGEWVIAVGNPFRLTSTVTTGIVSALGRQVDIIEDSFRIEDFIQTDAAINPGNSGGALVNLRGELVGVATAIATESGSYEGYGFAVPVDLVTRVASDLIAYGDVRRGYLGVQIRAVTAGDADDLGLDRIGGVVVEEVAEEGAAAEAGLRVGDVLLAVDGQEVDAPNQFQSAIALRRPGDAIALSLRRGGDVREVQATLIGREDDAFRTWVAEVGDGRRGPRPAPVPDDYPLVEPEGWGVGLRDLTRQEREAFGVEAGAYVSFVRQGGPAAADGLPSRAVIVEVEGEAVASAQQAEAALTRAAEAGGPVLLRVRRLDGQAAFYDLEPPS